MSWNGELIDLQEGRCLFYSGASEKIVLFIAGLGDGFFTVPYTHYLPNLLNEVGWSFAQVLIRSSYNNYGRFTLQDEADDLNAAINFITFTRSVKEIILMGHSTGCQDIMQYLKSYEAPACITKAILQGSVSDRESPLAPKDSMPTGDTFLVPGWIGVFTKARFESLFVKGGADDMFSSDLKCFPHLQHVKLPCLVLYSEQDEYVPDFVDKRGLLTTWKQLNNKLDCHLIPGTHFLPDKELFFQHCWPLIKSFIS